MGVIRIQAAEARIKQNKTKQRNATAGDKSGKRPLFRIFSILVKCPERVDKLGRSLFVIA